jgi:3D (Asp-Asp-Asp) domain-containing protein
MTKEKAKKRIISLKIAKKIILLLILVIIFDFFFFPAPVLANEYHQNKANINQIKATSAKNIKTEKNNLNQPKFFNTLPQNNKWQTVKTGYYTLTAYSSEKNQCDNTPCITANGFNLCQHNKEDSVAANFLPFGTKIRIPDLFGDRVFVVRDRMNARYQNRIDIWMSSTAKAKKFGIKIAHIEILEP